MPEPVSSPVIPPRRRLLAGAVLLATLSTGACGGSAEMPARAAAPLADQIFAATSLGTTTDPIYESPVETTPLTRYVVNGIEQTFGVSDLFVIGTVERVTAGYGYSWPSGPQMAGGPTTEVNHPFNHPDADICTLHLHATVDTALYRDEAYANQEKVVIGLALLSPVDVDSLNGEIAGKRIAAPLLANHRSFFRKEPGVYGVLLSGELLGFMSDDGHVEFPALHSLPRPQNGSRPLTVDDLLNPHEVINVRKTLGQYKRDS